MNNFYKKSVLDNGLRVVTSTVSGTRSASVSVLVGVGSRYEEDKEAGISHLIEHMLFRGTKKRPTSSDISMAIEGVGGILNGGTDKELTIYWCKVPAEHTALAGDVLLDMLTNSKLENEDLEKERHIIVEEINMINDSPSGRVSLLIESLLWPGHPLGREIAGKKEIVLSLGQDDITGYIARYYRPENTVVSVAGKVEHQEVLEQVGELLSGWRAEGLKPSFVPFSDGKVAKKLLVETRDIEQAHIALGLPGISLTHPDRYTVALLNIILGEGMSSRLFREVRDKLGLVYDIRSSVDHYLDSGAITIYAGVDPKNLKAALSATLDELTSFAETISDEELLRAKEMFKGRFILQMEDSRSVAAWLGIQEVLTGEILSVDEVISMVTAISLERLKEVGQSLLRKEELRLAVVGPQADYGYLEDFLR